MEESKEEYWFKCTGSKWCMEEEVRCNQEVDCDDKSDEEGCGIITISMLLNVLQITKPNARKQEDVLTTTTCAMVN